MAMKKVKPSVAKRVSDRKAFVAEKKASKGITDKQANQRFFIQTRMAEMKAKGKTVTPEMRKQLQQKFQSGNVSRKGFAAPKKKTGGSSSSSVGRTDSAGRSGFGANATIRAWLSDPVGDWVRSVGTGTGTGYTSSTPKQADKKKNPKTKYYPNTKK